MKTQTQTHSLCLQDKGGIIDLSLSPNYEAINKQSPKIKIGSLSSPSPWCWYPFTDWISIKKQRKKKKKKTVSWIFFFFFFSFVCVFRISSPRCHFKLGGPLWASPSSTMVCGQPPFPLFALNICLWGPLRPTHPSILLVGFGGQPFTFFKKKKTTFNYTFFCFFPLSIWKPHVGFCLYLWILNLAGVSGLGWSLTGVWNFWLWRRKIRGSTVARKKKRSIIDWFSLLLYLGIFCFVFFEVRPTPFAYFLTVWLLISFGFLCFFLFPEFLVTLCYPTSTSCLLLFYFYFFPLFFSQPFLLPSSCSLCLYIRSASNSLFVMRCPFKASFWIGSFGPAQ